ncbi:MAG: hypothetical protein GEV03_07930 [Streptosporangiales bacterium]|nr:hypothetical protein [Streptosporangiales bacterium]
MRTERKSLSVLTARPASAADPSSIPIDPVTFDAVYVVNGGDGETSSISVIDAERDTLAGTIELTDAAWPHHIYLSADGRRLAVAVPGIDLSMGHGEMPEPGMGAVMVLDARTGATVRSRTTPTRNHNAAFSLNGREIWTGQMMMDMPGTVLVLDPNTLETRREITAGVMPHEVTFAPEGNAYVANAMSNDVTVINSFTKRVVNTIPVGDLPVGAWQGDNGYAYVDNEHSMTVSAINRRAQRVAHTYDLGFTPGIALLGPDGHLWVTDADNGQVVLFSARRDVRLKEIPAGDGAHAIAFSGNGKTAYVTNQAANTVSVIDVRTHTVKKTIRVGGKPNGLLWRRG